MKPMPFSLVAAPAWRPGKHAIFVQPKFTPAGPEPLMCMDFRYGGQHFPCGMSTFTYRDIMGPRAPEGQAMQDE